MINFNYNIKNQSQQIRLWQLTNHIHYYFSLLHELISQPTVQPHEGNEQSYYLVTA